MTCFLVTPLYYIKCGSCYPYHTRLHNIFLYRKRKNSTKYSDSNSVENGSNTSEGTEEYCRCETQANIITETLHKLLAKKEQFLSEPCPNSQEGFTTSQSSERHVLDSQDSFSTSRDYDSDQVPSDDDGTVLTSTSHPSIPEQELD